MKVFIERLEHLIELGNITLKSRYSIHFEDYVERSLFSELRASSLSFIIALYGGNHPYYKNFIERVRESDLSDTSEAIGILNSIKTELDKGWIKGFKGIVSAEIFSDFLEMAGHLLSENYKDPAAVVIGSVLEEHLRQLAIRNEIPTENPTNGRPKKADLLNSELANANVYNKLDQKAVTSWLDLRNKAAHGNYEEYTKQQVDILLQSVMDFMLRNPL